MNRELTLAEIEQHYPHKWVLVEETAWDKQGNPVRGIVRAHNTNRRELNVALQEIHKQSQVKTFIFYTGEKIPEDLVVVL